MYAYIEGTIDSVTASHLILDNNGIGYEIMMPLSDLNRISGRLERIRVFTYYHVSENGVFLYGFLEKDEKELFLLLLSVNGVGPKAALSILGTLTSDELRFAIAGEDVKAISAANGIGAKTAKRIILDLKDKLDFEEMLDTTGSSGASSESSVRNDAMAALMALGYSSSEVIRAFSEMEISDGMTVEAVIKTALTRLL